uniref:Cation efflux protein cytoplasmic domain-containing protein n=1 Tax=Leptocylindrus danicus TaxID=163516 RepID=A0A7S2K600_9STRA|mmetsp:Transcript_17750/g.26448  ORF Transcript_17750/g.26448 Transcript_17750/m.26448 type:complete len:463 (+) Transcript_17750:170-1558(+)|eukprot:CAMPEP_0116024884 /NCGR_PEP_ID=MMETSP0321-20121206/12643_1 /TAXON_ID=163516 /ORGANISM="Leptocylindrus danicus var. danicus, Strain B650" /LENGTH=462 /DNA_ID=CAMNT_0003496821 /DNA_START=246 /DNA_END=1634 /DNA_ORIENTATION=+
MVSLDNKVLRKLKIASVLCGTFLAVEVTGGLISHSLAVLTDAAHLFADLASFVVAIFATQLASLPASSKHTYGLKRAEALAALFSVFSLVIVTFGLALEALRRLYMLYFMDAADLDPVDGKVMSIVAGLGVCVNLALAAVLGEHHVHGGQIHAHDHCHGHGHEHASSHDDGKNKHDDHDVDEENHAGHNHNHSHGGEMESLLSHSHSHSGGCKTKPKEGMFHITNGKVVHYYDSTSTEQELLVHSNEVPPHNHEHEHHGHDHNHNHGHGHGHAEEHHPKADEKDAHDNHGDDIENMNLRAAYLHVLGDLALSIAVLLAGLLILYNPSWQMADPLCTIFFSVLVTYSVIGTFKQSLSILMEETPPDINWDQVYDGISSVKGVTNVHDLHIWSISQGSYAISVHLKAVNTNAALKDVGRMCRVKYGIGHCTIQIQQSTAGTDDEDCFTCEEGDFDACHSNGRPQ